MYQLGGADGPVLYRQDNTGGTEWWVGDSSNLESCGDGQFYLYSALSSDPTGPPLVISGAIVQPAPRVGDGPPTAAAYNAGNGWTDWDGVSTHSQIGDISVIDSLNFRSSPSFTVVSGPCTIAEFGRCVGRWPGGYLANEECQILVAGTGSAGLGPCPVFDTYNDDVDSLTLPDGRNMAGDHCPAGTILTAGDMLSWHSDGAIQGSNYGGLPRNYDQGPGGGWQICFV
eukprot:SAG11_NODE_224_length_12103_cov_8.087054_3_plen_228_part_00